MQKCYGKPKAMATTIIVRKLKKPKKKKAASGDSVRLHSNGTTVTPR